MKPSKCSDKGLQSHMLQRAKGQLRNEANCTERLSKQQHFSLMIKIKWKKEGL